jgi:hypothetical protein
MKTSKGFGSGLSVTDAGKNYYFADPAAGVVLTNRSASSVYVLINKRITGAVEANTPAVGDDVPFLSAAQARADGILLGSDETVDLRGLSSTIGASIFVVALITEAGETATVSGGVNDVA